MWNYSKYAIRHIPVTKNQHGHYKNIMQTDSSLKVSASYFYNQNV